VSDRRALDETHLLAEEAKRVNAQPREAMVDHARRGVDPAPMLARIQRALDQACAEMGEKAP
jgi:hypothetical protein